MSKPISSPDYTQETAWPDDAVLFGYRSGVTSPKTRRFAFGTAAIAAAAAKGFDPRSVDNIAIGNGSQASSTDGFLNVTIGRNTGKYLRATSGQPLQTGKGNVAIGVDVLSNSGASCDLNTGVGAFTLVDLTSGYDNAAFGAGAMQFATTTQYCVAMGANALGGGATAGTPVTGNNNTAVGAKASFQNTSGHDNAGIGTSALYHNATGSFNVAIGSQAMETTTGADNCVAIGAYALQNVTANGIVAIGYFAGRNVSSGTANTLIGRQAGTAITTGSNHTAIGDAALGSMVSGASAVAIGRSALGNATVGYSIAIGDLAGYGQTTNGFNVYIGRNAGYAHTGSQNTAIGDNALSAAAAYNNCTGLGSAAAVTGSNQVQLGDSATTPYAYAALQIRSDARDKADIRPTALGLDFVMGLKPVDFRWNFRSDYKEGDAPGSKKRKRFHHGFIAQDVQALIAKTGVDFGGFQDHKVDGGEDVLSLAKEEMIGPLVRAVQELQAQVAELRAQIQKGKK